MTQPLERVRRELGTLGRAHTPTDVAEAMRSAGLVVTDQSLLEMLEALRRHSTGAGALEDLLRQDGISDIVVNGASEVFIDRGLGMESVQSGFDDDAQVRQLAVRLAAATGRRIDDSQPFVDGRLADGTRLHAVLSPISSPGTCISLRIPAKRGFTLQEMADQGSFSPRVEQLLRGIVTRKVPFLVTGGTGSGKTTLLSALLSVAPRDERIIIAEDSRELLPDHPHCVRLESRPPNAEGVGEITLTELVRQSLRMRPDRLVLGEVRGAELSDLLLALNTGHEGGCSTVHANSIFDAPTRLEALGALGGLDRLACHAQVASALKVVIHVARRTDGSRHISEIGLFRRKADGLVEVIPALADEGHGEEWQPGAEELLWLAGSDTGPSALGPRRALLS